MFQASGGPVKRIAGLIAVMAVALAAPPVRGQPGAGRAPCSGEAVAVVKAALRHALVDARDLPDLELVERSGPVRIWSQLWGGGCLLGDAVVPAPGRRTHALVGPEEARDLANRRGGPVAFVRAGDVAVAGAEASVWLGVSLQLADGAGHGATCCCGAQMFLRRTGRAWVFSRWGEVYCA